MFGILPVHGCYIIVDTFVQEIGRRFNWFFVKEYGKFRGFLGDDD